MENLTRKKYNDFLTNFARSNGMEKNDHLINYNSKEEKKFIAKLKKSAFFKLINIIGSKKLKGDIIGFFPPIAGNVDTEQHDRKLHDIFKGKSRHFNNEKVFFDTGISWQKLDALSEEDAENFDRLLAEQLDQNTLAAILIMAWNGTSRAENSNFDDNPLLQDVKKGLLQQIREESPNNVLSSVSIGKGQTYLSLDAAIKAALQKMPQAYAKSGELIAICGRDIIGDHPIQFSESNLENTVVYSQKQIGGLRAIGAPYFPDDAILITPLANLSLYYQTGTMRRFTLNNPEKDRVENYFSMNLDFIIENYQSAVLLENITIEETH